MYILILIIILIVAITLRIVYVLFKDKIEFFVTGLDSGFSLPDLMMLWNVSTVCELEIPTSLFYSMASLSKCMTKLTALAAIEGSDTVGKTQKLLSKLFDYRTKLQNISDKKKGILNTKELEKGHKLRIVLPGRGVYSSVILNNGSNIVISIPKQNDIITLSADDWVGHSISVYFWRKGDARYVFDTTVLQSGLYLGETALYLKQSVNLLRTQKRKSVRVVCHIPGTLFIMKKTDVDYTAVETRNGYKCLLQDISESGALIKIGGKGVPNINIKIQYSVNNRLIVMYGVIRTVEYREEKNISLLHFECTHIEPIMRNEVLSFVYSTMPDEQKEMIEALKQTDLDSDDAQTAQDAETALAVEAALEDESQEDGTPLVELSDENLDNTDISIPEEIAGF